MARRCPLYPKRGRWDYGDTDQTEPQGTLALENDGDPYQGKYDNEGYTDYRDLPEREPITDAKFWLTEEEIEDLVTEMEFEPNYIKAKGMLYRACAQIEKKTWMTEEQRKERKTKYINCFNTSRRQLSLAPKELPKAGETQ